MLAIHQAQLALRPSVGYFDLNRGPRLAVSADDRDGWSGRASEQRQQYGSQGEGADSDAQASMQLCSHVSAQI
jgi:hypothetical protein